MTALLRFGKAQSDNFQFKFQNPDTCLGLMNFRMRVLVIFCHFLQCWRFGLATSSGGQTFHGIMVIRPETTKGEFNVVFTFRIMQDKFASWATFQLLGRKIRRNSSVCPSLSCYFVLFGCCEVGSRCNSVVFFNVLLTESKTRNLPCARRKVSQSP